MGAVEWIGGLALLGWIGWVEWRWRRWRRRLNRVETVVRGAGPLLGLRLEEGGTHVGLSPQVRGWDEWTDTPEE